MVDYLGGALGKAVSFITLEYSTCGRDTALDEYGEGFECSYHVAWFRVECGGAACTLALVYVLFRLREVKFSSVKKESAQQTPSQQMRGSICCTR